MLKRTCKLLVASVLVLLAAGPAVGQAAAKPARAKSAATGNVTRIDHYVRHRSSVPVIAGQPVHLYVEEKILANSRRPLKGAVLFVHGATYPSEPDFDLRYRDYSYMDFLARAGFDVYGMDMEGYGRSSRPWPMEDPCNLSLADQQMLIPALLSAPCEPSYPFRLTTNKSDWDDLDAVVDFIRARTGFDRLDLVGWSQGGTRTGGYASLHPEKVDRLALFAPAYDRSAPAGLPETQPPGAPFTIQDHAGFIRRWNSEVACEDQVEPAAQEAMWRQNIASDPVAASWGHGFIRRPINAGGGWNATAAARVKAPTLMITGDLDATVPPARVRDLYDDLGSRQKLFVLVHCASHFALLETQHALLQELVRSWLVQDEVLGKTQGTARVGARPE